MASALDVHSIPFIATISSPTKIAWERSALLPGVIWKAYVNFKVNKVIISNNITNNSNGNLTVNNP